MLFVMAFAGFFSFYVPEKSETVPSYYRFLHAIPGQIPKDFHSPIPPAERAYSSLVWQVFYAKKPSRASTQGSAVHRKVPVIVNEVLRGRLISHHWYLWGGAGDVTIRSYKLHTGRYKRAMIQSYGMDGHLTSREIYNEGGGIYEIQSFAAQRRHLYHGFFKSNCFLGDSLSLFHHASKLERRPCWRRILHDDVGIPGRN